MKRSQADLTIFDDALRRWDEALREKGGGQRLPAERIAVADAIGRVPAAVLRTLEPCPPFGAAAMDGYAVRAAGTARAAADRPVSLRIGRDAVAIDTGAVVPDGFDAVVATESVTVSGAAIALQEPVARGRNVRLPGEDVPPGVAIGWPGLPLRPVDCAALLAGGCEMIDVVVRPRLIVIPTGDEVVSPGAPRPPGSIVETNSTMIAAEARALGADVAVKPIQRDDERAIESALREAVAEADVVLLIAGSSHGRRDRCAAAIEKVGDVVVRGIATRPGKPTTLARAGNVAIANLPGYPVACHFAFGAYVAPLLRRLAGSRDVTERRARLSDDVRKSPDFDEWRRATLLTAPGSPRAIVAPLESSGGGLYALTEADAIFRMRRGVERYGRHTAVTWTALRDADAASRPLLVAPYDPLIEEAAALGGFRCRWTPDESGLALDEGLADAVGVVVRDARFDDLRKRVAPGRKVYVLGMRREGLAKSAVASADAPEGELDDGPWSKVAAVAAGLRSSQRCCKYLADRYRVRFEEGAPTLFAVMWEERAGRSYPWGIVLAAALAALENAAEGLGWNVLGMPEDAVR